ncbi:hypothetical protein CDAR_604331 [Caerostris darwini]|uniref:Ycf15 n=1 Tax=Caerostris darwini TaxID=1538125 RepID=A0AAV4SXA3_9ARAC|nr:hypothetical protein CDAR_604331 [Caerostris darwini]
MLSAPMTFSHFSPKSPLGKEKNLIHASFGEKCPYLCVWGRSGQHLSGTPSQPELTNSPCKRARSLARKLYIILEMQTVILCRKGS